ncbi:reverse transcriptase domain-containing protein [Tanacetum coccineum]
MIPVSLSISSINSRRDFDASSSESYQRKENKLIRSLKALVSPLIGKHRYSWNVCQKRIVKTLGYDIIYPIAGSPWVSPIHCVPKKGGIIVVTNKNDELVLTRTITGWRVCIDYRKLNEATVKDHFPLPFMDQMLERLTGNKYFCFLDGFSGYFQIPIDPNDQEKTTFTCPFGTYAYRRMPFGLCNAPATFQRCMLAIFHDMIEESVEVSSAGLEVDKAKIDVISKLPPPTNIKGFRSFLRHAGFYRRFIKDFSKIARPITKLYEKDTPFEFDDECQKAFESLKEKLTCAPVIVYPNWNLSFELMYDASDFAVVAVLVSTSRYVVPTGRVVVPTGRVVVPTGRYVVPAGKARLGAKCGALRKKCGELRELMRLHYIVFSKKFVALAKKCGSFEELMQEHLLTFNSSKFRRMCGAQYYKCGGVLASQESVAHNVASATDFLIFG